MADFRWVAKHKWNAVEKTTECNGDPAWSVATWIVLAELHCFRVTFISVVTWLTPITPLHYAEWRVFFCPPVYSQESRLSTVYLNEGKNKRTNEWVNDWGSGHSRQREQAPQTNTSGNRMRRRMTVWEKLSTSYTCNNKVRRLQTWALLRKIVSLLCLLFTRDCPLGVVCFPGDHTLERIVTNICRAFPCGKLHPMMERAWDFWLRPEFEFQLYHLLAESDGSLKFSEPVFLSMHVLKAK